MYLYFVYNKKLEKFLAYKSPIVWGNTPLKSGIFTDASHIESMFTQNEAWKEFKDDCEILSRWVDLM